MSIIDVCNTYWTYVNKMFLYRMWARGDMEQISSEGATCSMSCMHVSEVCVLT